MCQAKQTLHLLHSFIHHKFIELQLRDRDCSQHRGSGMPRGFLDIWGFQRGELWIAEVFLNKTWDLPLRFWSFGRDRTQWTYKGICQHSETHTRTHMYVLANTHTHTSGSAIGGLSVEGGSQAFGASRWVEAGQGGPSLPCHNLP